MKKFKYVFMAMIAVLCSAAFTACGGDDDNPDGQSSTGNGTSSFYYSFDINEDILSIADVKINYIDTNGDEQSEYITKTSWSKTFTADKFDVSAGVAISMTLKSGAELTKDKYNIKYTFSYVVASTKNGARVDNKANISDHGSSSVEASKVESKLKETSGSTAFKINAEGKIEKTQPSWQDNGVNNDLELIPFL